MTQDLTGSEEVLTTSDGVTLARRHWEVQCARATVVLVHGFAASTGDAAVVRQAEALQAEGFEVRSYDSRGHGRSGGVCTLGNLESLDVAAAVEWSRPAGLPIVLVGASLGAIAVLRYAASYGRGLAGVVTISSPAAWRAPRSIGGLMLAALTQTRPGQSLARRHMGVRLAPRWMAPSPPCELAGRLEVPLAVIHGDRDRYIPVRDANELHDACLAPRRLDIVAGMGHAFDARAVAPVSAAIDWLLAIPATTPVI